MGRSYLHQAQRILAEAKRHRGDEAWNLVVRRCQEAVEPALKAILRVAGLEVPHVHDVGVFLSEHAARLPPEIVAELDRLISISRRLRQEREISFYGSEELAAPPERLYTRGDADDALRDASFVVTLTRNHLPA